jgi:hypothetical protein
MATGTKGKGIVQSGGNQVSAQAIVFHKAEPVPACAKDLLATLQKASPVNKSKNLICCLDSESRKP